MDKRKSIPSKPIDERGGYGSGDKLVSDLKPPPPGPAPGAKPSTSDGQKK